MISSSIEKKLGDLKAALSHCVSPVISRFSTPMEPLESPKIRVLKADFRQVNFSAILFKIRFQLINSKSRICFCNCFNRSGL